MTPPEPDSWQTTASQLLMKIIADKRQITYNQLAVAAGLSGPHRIHRLTSWLEKTMAEDQRCGRPFRAAVVISKARDGLPAPGFFLCAEQLGMSLNAPDRKTAYNAHLDQLYQLLA